MTMENQPFEDVSPIENGEFPASHVSFQGMLKGMMVYMISVLEDQTMQIYMITLGDLLPNLAFFGLFGSS